MPHSFTKSANLMEKGKDTIALVFIVLVYFS